MQLDRTRIVVRERGFADILDLSLRTFRVYAKPLGIAALIGILPFFLFNFVLLRWMLADVIYGVETYDDDIRPMLRYANAMWILVVMESHLATVFMTTFIGQAVFTDSPSLREVVRETLKSWRALAWCHLFVRGVGISWLCVWMARDQPIIGDVLLGLTLVVISIVRMYRPHLNEIIVLEKNPLRAQRRTTKTIGKRGAELQSGDLLGRWVAGAFVSSGLAMGLFGVLMFLTAVFLKKWLPGPILLQVGFPFSLWCVAAFGAVARFLCYLDLRIRNEGWELELRLRAEANRMNERQQPSVGTA